MALAASSLLWSIQAVVRAADRRPTATTFMPRRCPRTTVDQAQRSLPRGASRPYTRPRRATAAKDRMARPGPSPPAAAELGLGQQGVTRVPTRAPDGTISGRLLPQSSPLACRQCTGRRRRRSTPSVLWRGGSASWLTGSRRYAEARPGTRQQRGSSASFDGGWTSTAKTSRRAALLCRSSRRTCETRGGRPRRCKHGRGGCARALHIVMEAVKETATEIFQQCLPGLEGGRC